jgi:regulator of protease activity HflC (stomatin/prohibitin superfamily)
MSMSMSLIYGIVAGSALVVIYAFFRSGFRVDNGNTAVLAVFGRFVRDAKGTLKTFGPGLHWRAPWAQVIPVSLAERSLSLGGTPDKPAAIEALASDGTRIRVNARLRFRVEPNRVATYLAEAKDAIEHLSGLFRLTMREQIARFEQLPTELSAFTALRLRMNELQHRTLEAMKHPAFAEYGIEVTSVDLLQIDPPEELVDALNAVITAESEASSLVARTDLQVQQRLLAAEQAVAIAHAHALATESEIQTVGAELSSLAEQGTLRDYVARRRTEVLGGSRRVYLNHNASTTNLRS